MALYAKVASSAICAKSYVCVGMVIAGRLVKMLTIVSPILLFKCTAGPVQRDALKNLYWLLRTCTIGD